MAQNGQSHRFSFGSAAARLSLRVSPPTVQLSHKASNDSYDEYLMAMKRVHRESTTDRESAMVAMTPRDRHRKREGVKKYDSLEQRDSWASAAQATRISTIASMVPDEIIYKQSDYTVRDYETALMFIDVSGFTQMCETYTKTGKGGPSRLTQVLNSYIGAMVQEILAHNGDVLKFSGDAVLSMWKKTPTLTMQDIVHTAIDCGLIIQRNYGTYVTDVGGVLKVKVAISAGLSHFSIIGETQRHYVIVGQPVWDCKNAELLSAAGDVITSASAWKYVNEADYCTQPSGGHTKVLGVGAKWKRVEKMYTPPADYIKEDHIHEPSSLPSSQRVEGLPLSDINYREFSLRPSVVAAMQGTWWLGLRRFMVTPVLRAVDNDEPMDFLTEVRRVVVVFVNIITYTVSANVLIEVVDKAYRIVCSVTSAAGGLVNKVSMFDKDMMFLVVFGLRGLKHEDETQKAIECSLQLQKNLDDKNIKCVSIGVTSGTTYCGVVGYVLRREYTVIGSAVNKAARLMMMYVNKITCDKETFLRSKLNQGMFKLADTKALKGFAKPEPIYEVRPLKKWTDRVIVCRHPLLGRAEDLLKFETVLENALKQHKQRFTKYRDHKFAFAIIGPKSVGKTRFMEECMIVTPKAIPVETVNLTPEHSKVPYCLIRLMTIKVFTEVCPPHLVREKYENKIRNSISVLNMTPVEIYAINTIFGCRFPLPEHYEYKGDILDEHCVRILLLEIFVENFTPLWMFTIEDMHYADDESWRIVLIMLETKSIFIIMTLNDSETLSSVAMKCLASNVIVKSTLGGIDRWFHAALACQLLDVQAIPADLENIIQSASGGMPGWIQNFVISLVQRSALSVVTMPRTEAIAAGAILPLPSLLVRCDMVYGGSELDGDSATECAQLSLCRLNESSEQQAQDNAMIQVAVLSNSYNLDNMKIDMSMDAIILKTYDSLNPFEKMILKCSSVLGDVFSRRMLLHLLQSDSQRKVAQAIEKLFDIRVLECEGGDFISESSYVMVHPAPSKMTSINSPHCSCLGTRVPLTCRDLPHYAFCGYMKFKHTLFRTTTYELLTETQKQELHGRALMYLERYTRRCTTCGAGCFIKMLGTRIDDGLPQESEEMKRMRQQILALNDETKEFGESTHVSTRRMSSENIFFEDMNIVLGTTAYNNTNGELRHSRHVSIHNEISKEKFVRSFSSIDLANCECWDILLTAYDQLIEHCRGAVQLEKLFEAYLEYADLSVIRFNIPQAMRLLNEVEQLVESEKFCQMEMCENKWYTDYLQGRILTLRGWSIFGQGDIMEAKKHLLQALKLYRVPFPNSEFKVKLDNMTETFHQIMAIYVVPSMYAGRYSGLDGKFYEEVATTLHMLYMLFTECKDMKAAALAAKRAFNFAIETDSNFRLLCSTFADMLSTYRYCQKFSRCVKLQDMAVKLCSRKRVPLDVTEVPAVCYLYTNIFLFNIEYGKKNENLEFGMTVMGMLPNLSDMATRQLLLISMLKLLMADMRLQEMVSIMREFFCMNDNYDMSSETWYHYYALVILLDTGYCVETFDSCERFYVKKGDAILKFPEAAWNFFVSMWLMTIRLGLWERKMIWQEKIKGIMAMKFERHAIYITILSRLVEGLLIALVNEIDNRNTRKAGELDKKVKSVFKEIKHTSQNTPLYRARTTPPADQTVATVYRPNEQFVATRVTSLYSLDFMYYLLYAYYMNIRGKRQQGYNYLNKAYDVAEQLPHKPLMRWTEHTRDYWNGNLNHFEINFWVDHMDPDKVLDYRDFDLEKGMQIIPFTLPLPKDLVQI